MSTEKGTTREEEEEEEGKRGLAEVALVVPIPQRKEDYMHWVISRTTVLIRFVSCLVRRRGGVSCGNRRRGIREGRHRTSRGDDNDK